ncbi:hypothetical protein V1J52_22710 [Streptomyces sp. TRM 70351]|uniref:hypothetical protein n=1 Tax=Streptomyces sp. TRM 70351 TaxID=3116552 RepID=UPI002E7AD962|nr:hypothetical protein [Streptomyces sp. TRM 70351]MEE1930954.1 hypothetical protein [Streptomyces sp. TRM 70351]
MSDVLGSGRYVIGGDSIVTDGEWVWRRDLGFYVRRYHVRLPEEFLNRVRSFGYTVPLVDDERLKEITFEVAEVM